VSIVQNSPIVQKWQGSHFCFVISNPRFRRFSGEKLPKNEKCSPYCLKGKILYNHGRGL
jgi:hypothetical protein